VVGLTLGSAGVAFAKPLSESQWRKKATAICHQINDEVADAGNEVFADLGPQEEPSTAELTTFVEQVLPVIEEALVSINKLAEPKSLRKGITKFNREVTEVMIALDEDPTVLLTGEDPFTDAN